MSAKHLSRYVGEFANRHNALDKTTESQMRETLAAAIGKTMPYKKLIA